MSATKHKTFMPTLIVFLISIFLSASLLFMVQPMAGKMLLPLVGGAPSGWIVALAFFQLSLLVGYILAHWFSKLSPRLHGLAVVTLLGLGCLFLPLTLGAGVEIEQSATAAFNVFILLTSAVAVPFIALSSVSSTLQRLFHYADATRGKDPYFLYAVSNFGSFLGLLGYPVFIEPFLPVTQQTHFWMFGYIILMAGILCASFLTKPAVPATQDNQNIVPPALKTGLYWIALAFIPSSLMVGMTNFVTLEITPIPLFWVLPLALYLLTYIVAFSIHPDRYKNLFVTAHPLAVLGILILFVFSMKLIGWTALVLHLVFFGVIAMMCHAQLASVRPDPKYLTAFYLYLAVGGALGGVLNAFIAPEIFTQLYEYPIVALFSLVFSPLLLKKYKLNNKMRFAIVVIGAASLSLLIISLMYAGKNSIFMTRNFFGPINVSDRAVMYKDRTYTLRSLSHGTTIHGIEMINEDFNNTAAYSYYAVLKPFFNTPEIPSRSIGVIGLGAGTLLCYQRDDRYFTSFEIDSEIVDVARKHFGFIENCDHPENRIIVGDGRLELAKQERSFDILVMDAFSSDTIPAHLLTYEAFESYFEKLNNNGIILINISNRYFNLAKTIAKIVENFGYQTFEYFDARRDLPPWVKNSHWLVLSKDKVIDWQPVEPDENTKLWTDDYTHVLSTLKGWK